MKTFKRFTALVLALVMAAMLAVSAYAATVVVKYKVYVYTSQLTFKQYDYSSSTTPSTRNLTILADSSLGSGSALYHVKYVDGTVAYCIQPGVRSDDSRNYVQGSSGCWYNLPASVQNGIALALACGYLRERYFDMLINCTCMSAVCEVGASDAQLCAYRQIIDLADVVLGVYDLDSQAVGDAEDRALAYAVDTANKPVLVLDPIKLTMSQINAP